MARLHTAKHFVHDHSGRPSGAWFALLRNMLDALIVGFLLSMLVLALDIAIDAPGDVPEQHWFDE